MDRGFSYKGFNLYKSNTNLRPNSFHPGQFLLTVQLICFVMIALVGLNYNAMAQEVPVFFGSSPPVADSSGTLVLNDDLQNENTFQWQSSDSVLGEIDAEAVTATTWTYLPGSPARLVFVGSNEGATFYGNVIFGDYNRAVVDVVKEAKRVRYLLNKIGIRVIDLNGNEQEDVPAVDADVLNDIAAEQLGNPKNAPTSSRFTLINQSFLVELNFKTLDPTQVDTITATLKGITQRRNIKLELSETAKNSNRFRSSSGAIDILLTSLPTFNNATVEEIEINIFASPFDPLTTFTKKLIETQVGSNTFKTDILDLTITFSAPLSDTTVDIVDVVVEKKSGTPKITTKDITTLKETSTDSGRFENAGGTFVVELDTLPGFAPSARDDLSAWVTSDALGVADILIQTIETGLNTNTFSSAAISVQPPAVEFTVSIEPDDAIMDTIDVQFRRRKNEEIVTATLTETGVDTFVFENYDGSIQISILSFGLLEVIDPEFPDATISNGLILNAGIRDRIHVSALVKAFDESRTFNYCLVEKGTDTGVFSSSPVQILFELDNPLSDSVRDTLSATAIDVSSRTVELELLETASDSLVFENIENAFTLTFLDPEDRSLAKEISVEMLVTSDALAVENNFVVANQNSDNSLSFATPGAVIETTDPNDLTLPRSNRFKIKLIGPASLPEGIGNSVELIALDENGQQLDSVISQLGTDFISIRPIIQFTDEISQEAVDFFSQANDLIDAGPSKIEIRFPAGVKKPMVIRKVPTLGGDAEPAVVFKGEVGTIDVVFPDATSARNVDLNAIKKVFQETGKQKKNQDQLGRLIAKLVQKEGEDNPKLINGDKTIRIVVKGLHPGLLRVPIQEKKGRKALYAKLPLFVSAKLLFGLQNIRNRTLAQERKEVSRKIFGLAHKAGLLDANGMTTGTIKDIDLLTEEAWFSMWVAQKFKPHRSFVYAHGTGGRLQILWQGSRVHWHPGPTEFHTGGVPFARNFRFANGETFKGLFELFKRKDDKLGSSSFITIMGCDWFDGFGGKPTKQFLPKAHIITTLPTLTAPHSPDYTAELYFSFRGPDENAADKLIAEKIHGKFFPNRVGSNDPIEGRWTLDDLKTGDGPDDTTILGIEWKEFKGTIEKIEVKTGILGEVRVQE
jgi:hypothetical protein